MTIVGGRFWVVGVGQKPGYHQRERERKDGSCDVPMMGKIWLLKTAFWEVHNYRSDCTVRAVIGGPPQIVQYLSPFIVVWRGWWEVGGWVRDVS